MEGIIHNYCRSRSRQYTNRLIVELTESRKRMDAEKFIGKTVVFRTITGKEIKGEVRGPHGNNGRLYVLFERGIPGQALGGRVEVL